MGPVERWLDRVAERSRQSYFSVFEGFRRSAGLSAEDLIARQRGASGDSRFELLDRLEAYVNGLAGTRSYKMFVYSAVRSFFLHNRCELPRDRFNIQNARPSTAPCMNVDHVRRIVLAASLRDRSMLLCGFMGLMGIGEIEYVNLNCWPQIKKHLDQDVIRVDLPKRKRNTQPYYTFIAGDALEALREYLAKRTDNSECIWIGKYQGPVMRTAYYRIFHRLAQRVGYIDRKRGSLGTRYGYNPHEMRDLARSLWHQSGADRDVGEFLMGHTVDPLKYDKIYTLDPEWVKDEYLKALPYLNIISAVAAVKQQQDQMEAMQKELQDLRERQARVEAISMEKIRVKE